MITRRQFAKRYLGAGVALWVPGVLGATRLQKELLLLSKPPTAQAASGGEGGGYSYIYQQDFESGTIPSSWAANTTVAWNYATAPAPLVGNYSCSMANGNDARYSLGLGGVDEIWFFMLVNSSNVGSMFLVYSAGFADELLSVARSGTDLYLGDGGGANATTVSAGIALGSTIRLWTHYKKGTGSNGVVELWWSDTDTIQTNTAHHCVASNAGGTVGADEIVLGALYGGAGQRNIFDKLRVSTSAIGSNPN